MADYLGVCVLQELEELQRLATAQAKFYQAHSRAFEAEERERILINFSRDLATMLNAGLPMLRSLDILYRQAKKQSIKELLRNIIQDLEKGTTFSEACGKYSDVFPPIFTRLIKVGEEVGSLASVLEQLSTYMAKEEETASKVKGSMAYPVFVACVAI